MQGKINMTYKATAAVRKAVAVMAFLSSCVCVFMLLYGVIPFRGRLATPLMVIENIVQFFYIGKRTFLHVICSVIFIAVYAWMAIKSVVDIFIWLKSFKSALTLKNDCKESRAATAEVSNVFDSVLYRLFFVLLTSFLTVGYSMLDKVTVYTFVGLIASNMLVHFGMTLLYKSNILSGVFCSLCKGLLLLLIFAIPFLCPYIKISGLLKTVYNVIVFISTGVYPSTEAFWIHFTENFLIPISGIMLLFYAMDVFDYQGMGSKYLIKKSQKLLFSVLGVFAITFAISGYVHNLRHLSDYILYFAENITIALLALLVYIIGCNMESKLPNVGYVDKYAPQLQLEKKDPLQLESQK